MRRHSWIAGLIACFCCAVEAHAQLQLASITAAVVDSRGEPIANAVVTLNDPLGSELQRAATNALGRASFDGVTPGRYLLQTRASGAAVFDLPIMVSGALPIEMIVRVPAAIADAVIVEGRAPDEPSSRGSI